MISHHSEKEVIDQKESAGSDQHRIKHQASSCRTDQDSIPQEGGKAGKAYFVGMAGFGASAPADRLYKEFGITAEATVAKVEALLG